jgi:hypothetical protein
MAMVPFKPPHNFKFRFFFLTATLHDFVTNHTPNESPDISIGLIPSSSSPTSLTIMKGKCLLVFESRPTFEFIDHM